MIESLSENSIFLVLFLIVPALVAGGMALFIHVWNRKASFRRKVLIASLTGGFLPLLLPIVVILITGDAGSEGALVIAILILTALILSAVIGVPASYFVLRKMDTSPDDSDIADTFR